jgi:hypothetical protein
MFSTNEFWVWIIGGVIVGDNYSNSGGIFIGENTLYVILTNTNECDEGLGSMTATVSGGQATI